VAVEDARGRLNAAITGEIPRVARARAIEAIALCGLYALIGYMTTAFAIEPEPNLPQQRPGRS
jgi:hypothetical protein